MHYSSSVADAIDLMLSVHTFFFRNAETKVYLMEIIDRFFNLSNVKNSYTKGFKQPIKLCKQIIWNALTENSIEYLLTLKTTDCTSLVLDRKKTFNMGFMQAVLKLQRQI